MAITSLIVLLAIYLGGAGLVQIVAYLIALRLKRVDIVDAAWGMSFIAGYLALQLYEPRTSLVVVLVGVMILAWGTRLSSHILKRFLRSSTQDERYTQLMAGWPKRYHSVQLFVRIFMVQAMLATIIGLPSVLVYEYEPGFGWITLLGVAVWCVGYGIEITADRQLKTYLQGAKPGGLMQAGLWQYSRHPNYFGEITMWWGLAIISLVTPLWWLGVLGAVTITLLICFISGIPPAEARASSKKGWSTYRKNTSVLVPLPPRK